MSYEKEKARPYSSVPKERTLDYGVIKKPLDDLLKATENRIKNDWPTALARISGMKALFQFFAPVAANTFHTIRYICADSPDDPARRLEYALSAGPLIRALLDQVFALAFISEEPAARVELYYQAGWKEVQQSYLRYKAKYGGDPEWQPWLDGKVALLEDARSKWAIPEAIRDERIKEPYWPIPNKMMKRAHGPVKAYLEHLDAWFYKRYSQSAHLSFPGLASRGGAFAIEDKTRRTEYLKKGRSDAMLSSISLTLAILSEIEAMCHFGHASRLQFLWTVTGEYWSEAKEIYSLRYQKLLLGQGSA